MEFWGVEVKAGEKLQVQPEFGQLIHISQASLGEVKDVKGAKNVPLRVMIDNKSFIIGTLSAEVRPQLMFDLVFEREFELSHDWKNGSIYFNGYVAEDPISEDDDISSGDDVSEDDLELEAPGNGFVSKAKAVKPAEKAAAVAAKAGAKDKAKKGEEQDSDSDSDDDDSEFDSNDEMALDGTSQIDSSDVSEDNSDNENEDESEEELPKVKQSKKRPAESAEKTPLPKKAKSATPDKSGNLVAPPVVHVSRPKDVEKQRMGLPIVMMEQEIMEAITGKISVIICGETGCGKTTQVPQFLYEAGFGSHLPNARGGIIGVTQPRRVAVLATAKRLAFELGLRLGKEVGFQVRHDRKVGENCSIKFMTDGILLREVQNDFLLRCYSVLILDEAHERSLNTDILIGMLSRVIQERQREYVRQEKEQHAGKYMEPENRIYPLKLVLMSATLRVEDFVSDRRIFRNPPPVIEVPTRQFPVTMHFSKKTEIVDYVGQAFKKVLSIHKRLPPGGILVFVTGQREVEFLCQRLRRASRKLVDNALKGNNEASSTSEEKPPEGNDIQEISEAFEFQGNSGHETERFDSHIEEDHEFFSEDESDTSYDSGEESDLEFFSDGENQSKPDSEGNLSEILGAKGTLASLKAAFGALPGKNASDSNTVVQDVSQTPEGVDQSCSLSKQNDKDKGFSPGQLHVLPLYAMLPASSQLRVFEEAWDGERLVVVATNVAETSLTIPGIKYVVDTGREKVKNYNSSNGMETYEVQWISKASAAQRAGRAGRTGPGHCYRLYSAAAFCNLFPDFSIAEISKVPVDGVVLLLKSMHIDKVANFPFPTPPETDAFTEAERCLKVLEALDEEGRLTALGRAMARYPMSPRHSRMLLTVIQSMQKVKKYARPNLVLAYAVAAAAALSLSNPFLRHFENNRNDADDINHADGANSEEGKKVPDREEKLRIKKLKQSARASREKFSNPTSDALTVAFALQCFELSESQTEFSCRNALHHKTMQEMSKLRKQLLQLVFTSCVSDLQQDFSWTHGTIEDLECAWKISSDKHPLVPREEETLRQAICAGWADRVAKRIRGASVLSEGERPTNAVRYQACMVKKTVFLHRWSSVSKSAPEFLIYSELLQSKRPYIHGATCVEPNWLPQYGRVLCSFSAPLSEPKPYYDPMADQVFSWVAPSFGPHLWQLPLHGLPIEDNLTRVAVFSYYLLDGQVLPCLKAVRDFMAAPPATMLRPEARGLKRVGNLLGKLNTKGRVIDTRAKLRTLWKENPRELFAEIEDWFQEGFREHFKEVWKEMLREVVLDSKGKSSKRVKRERRKTEEFVGTESLAMHAFTSTAVGLRSQHLGLHKALCALMGWKTTKHPSSEWHCQVMTNAEIQVLKEDLIIWPPVVIVHNSTIDSTRPGERIIISAEKLDTKLRDMGFGSILKVCNGKPANQSVMLVKFNGTLSGLQEAEMFHCSYIESEHGRAEFKQLKSISGSSRGGSSKVKSSGKEDEFLYGYLGIAEDLDKLDFDTKKRCVLKSKMQILSIVDVPIDTRR